MLTGQRQFATAIKSIEKKLLNSVSTRLPARMEWNHFVVYRFTGETRISRWWMRTFLFVPTDSNYLFKILKSIELGVFDIWSTSGAACVIKQKAQPTTGRQLSEHRISFFRRVDSPELIRLPWSLNGESLCQQRHWWPTNESFLNQIQPKTQYLMRHKQRNCNWNCTPNNSSNLLDILCAETVDPPLRTINSSYASVLCTNRMFSVPAKWNRSDQFRGIELVQRTATNVARLRENLKTPTAVMEMLYVCKYCMTKINAFFVRPSNAIKLLQYSSVDRSRDYKRKIRQFFPFWGRGEAILYRINERIAKSAVFEHSSRHCFEVHHIQDESDWADAILGIDICWTTKKKHFTRQRHLRSTDAVMSSWRIPRTE